MSLLVGRKLKLVSVVQPSNIVEVNTGLTNIDAPSIAGDLNCMMEKLHSPHCPVE
jgi:hypothetical protein